MRKLVMLLLGVLLLCGQLLAQTRVITGQILDASGSPVPNASILVKGTKTGTSSSEDGRFSLTVPGSARTLTISAIGMATQEVAISGRSTVSVVMSTSEKTLDEVVITGVGTATSKKKIAFAVESVTAKDLPKVSTASIDQALVGKIAGAQIQSTSGQPGQQAAIILRGINTLGTTQPMILVDGVQIQAGNNLNGSDGNLSSRLSDIDLSNIERVEVIQGSAAATIYGAQGANGVIQLFTKKGKSGRAAITINSRASFDNVLTGNLKIANKHYYDTDADGYILDGTGKRIEMDENGFWSSANGNISGTTLNNKPFKEKTYDHIDQVFRKNAMTLNNTLNISGGGEKSDYAINIANTSQKSILFGKYNRTNLSLNLGAELFKNFNVRSTTQLVFSDNGTGGVNGENNINSALGTALASRQWWDLTFKDPLGNYVLDPEKGNSVNPFYNNQFREYTAKNTRIIQGINLNYKPVHFLEIDYKYGIDNYRYDFTEFIKNQTENIDPGIGISPINGRITYDNDNQTLQNSLATIFLRADAERDFGWSIPLQSTTQIAYDWRKDYLFNTTNVGAGFPAFPPFNLNSAPSKDNTSEVTEKITYGYLINQRFDYGNLFGVSGGIRIDYSSAFGAGADPFRFPRGDAYFRISELLKSNTITELKIRGAYGEAGIQPKAYDRFITLESGNVGDRGSLLVKSVLNDPLIDVEVSKESEIGLDAGIRANTQNWFRNTRLSATYWTRKSTNVIRELEVAPSSGALTTLTNGVDFSSKGFQFSVDAEMYNSAAVTWNFGVRFGKQSTTVDRIANHKDIAIGTGGDGEFVIKEGEKLGVFFGVTPLKAIDQTDSKGGLIIPAADADQYEVVNGMVVNKALKTVKYTSEKVAIGDPTPKFNMSFTNEVTFKNFTFSAQLDWYYGNKTYNATKQWLYRDLIHGDLDNEVVIDGVSGAYVNYYNSLYNTNQTNSYFVEDGSFARLRNLSVSYNFTSALNRTGSLSFVKDAQFSLSGRNLFTITNYSGLDPESGAAINSPLRRGLDLYAFPNFRTFQMALSLGF